MSKVAIRHTETGARLTVHERLASKYLANGWVTDSEPAENVPAEPDVTAQPSAAATEKNEE